MTDAYPVWGPRLRSEAWGCAVCGGFYAVIAAYRRERLPRISKTLALAAIGTGLLAAPAAGAIFRGAAHDAFSRTTAFCFVPLIVLVWNGVRAEAEARMTIWPGLAGIAGALFLFPLDLPTEAMPYVELLVPAFAAGAAVVYLQGRQSPDSGAWEGASLLFGAAAGLAVMEAARLLNNPGAGRTTHWQGVLVDIAVGWLTVLSARRVNSLRYASRYFLVPVVTILEGVLLFHQEASSRLWLGLLLLLGGAASLWVQGPEPSDRTALHQP